MVWGQAVNWRNPLPTPFHLSCPVPYLLKCLECCYQHPKRLHHDECASFLSEVLEVTGLCKGVLSKDIHGSGSGFLDLQLSRVVSLLRREMLVLHKAVLHCCSVCFRILCFFWPGADCLICWTVSVTSIQTANLGVVIKWSSSKSWGPLITE